MTEEKQDCEHDIYPHETECADCGMNRWEMKIAELEKQIAKLTDRERIEKIVDNYVVGSAVLCKRVIYEEYVKEMIDEIIGGEDE